MLVLFRGWVAHKLYRLLSKLSWKEVMLVVLIHFLSSWVLIQYFDQGREYVGRDTYWWYYIVTITTVGYGDFSPESLGGRLVSALYVMPLGIAFMGAIIGKIAAVLVDLSIKLRRGLMQLHLNDHTVVVGDNSSRTIDLLQNLIADPTVGKIALVSTREESPMNGRIDFVSGEVDDPIIQERVCLGVAKCIIVLADSDVTVTGRTISCMDANPDARIISYFRHSAAASNLNRQSPERVCTVTSIDMAAVVQEALDPGAAGFARQLLRNDDGETYLRLTIPPGIKKSTFIEVAVILMQQRINPLGLYRDGKPVTCPEPNATVREGTILAVAATNRSALESIDWSALR